MQACICCRTEWERHPDQPSPKTQSKALPAPRALPQAESCKYTWNVFGKCLRDQLSAWLLQDFKQMLSVFPLTRRIHPLGSVIQHQGSRLEFPACWAVPWLQQTIFLQSMKVQFYIVFQKSASLAQDFNFVLQTTTCVNFIGIQIHNSQFIWNRLFTEIPLNWLSFY